MNSVWKMMRERQKVLLIEGDEGEVAYMEKKKEKFMTFKILSLSW